MSAPAVVPLPQLQAMAASLAEPVWRRLMTRAQKAALIQWRDSTTAPGLAARMTRAGKDAYGYADRISTPRRKRGTAAAFNKSGALARMLATRRPRGIRDPAMVRTRLAIGGGALNFLGGMRGGTVSTVRVPVAVQISAHAVRTHTRRSTGVAAYARASYSAIRIRRRTNRQEWEDFSKDAPGLRRMVADHFLTIVRSAAYTKTGRTRAGFAFPARQELDDA
jgi:hypothetical protein